jgi:hypothetical protein
MRDLTRLQFLGALGALASITACSQGSAPIAAAPAETATVSLSDELVRTGSCYAREYDAAHLAAHPHQTVTHFSIGDAGADWRPTETAGQRAVAFGFRITGHADTYSGVAMCAPNGDALACNVEGDGGSFEIAHNDAGLRVTLQRLEVEGANDFSPDLAEADNHVMLLSPAAASACAR